MAKENKQFSKPPQAVRALAPSCICSPRPRHGASLWMRGLGARGPGQRLQSQQEQRDGNPAGRLHFPTLFSFHIVHSFKNDFTVENEQTQLDLSGPTHKGDAHMGTQAHIHIYTEAYRHTHVH